jgi:glycosyltransferase involved in cell wall biosynthesis
VQRLRCWVSWQKRRIYESRVFRQFDLCTMVSEQDRQSTLAMLPGYRGPVEVIPNGVDCRRNRPGLAQPTPDTLIFNGALTYSANYDAMRYFLHEIYPRIRQQVPSASLTITGSTSGVDQEGLGLTDGVRLSGYVEDVRPMVAGAWGCVVPLRQGGGTRLKVLEAMALGTPVVATTKAVEGLEIVPNRHVLVADDPEQFAQQVVRLLGDADLRVSLASSGRRLVERSYDWSRIGERFVGLCEGIAGSGG